MGRLRRGLPGILLLLLPAARPAMAAAPDPMVAAWLNAQTRLLTWSADVVQTRTLRSLVQPVSATGRVWFEAPQRFRWELGDPAQTLAFRQTDHLLVVYPRLNRAERYPLTGPESGPWRDVLALLDAGFPRSARELEARFRIVGQQSLSGLFELTLQPRSPKARRLMPSLKVTFATNDFSLRSTELELADGSTLRNDFRNPVLNPKLDDQLFTPRLAPGTTVVEMGRKP